MISAYLNRRPRLVCGDGRDRSAQQARQKRSEQCDNGYQAVSQDMLHNYPELGNPLGPGSSYIVLIRHLKQTCAGIHGQPCDGEYGKADDRHKRIPHPLEDIAKAADAIRQFTGNIAAHGK